MRELNVEANELTSLPSELCHCERLKTLNLGDNKVAALPDSIGDLGGLVNLIVYENALDDLPASLAKCAQLEVLNTDGTETCRCRCDAGAAAIMGFVRRKWDYPRERD